MGVILGLYGPGIRGLYWGYIGVIWDIGVIGGLHWGYIAVILG